MKSQRETLELLCALEEAWLEIQRIWNDGIAYLDEYEQLEQKEAA